ncbi:ABC transporter ATP-binding protein [Clostridium thermarum]|uniref:ABC transporter ATP-binding protein n=1 Tax=Clostridium thermarum TaxID=1716543 RepID=UPI0013D4AB01|nr:ABC transporter ATP-binding protein [Clostridium thermarum]
MKNSQKTKKTNSSSKRPRVKNLIRLLQLALPFWKLIALSALCVILVNGATLVKPYILKLVIDDFLMKGLPSKGLYSITSMGIIYFLVVSISGLLSITQVNLINKAAQEIMSGLRRRVFRLIQLMPLSYLHKTSSGRLITRATNDIEALSEMYTDVIINLFKDIFLLIGIVYAMLALNVKLALVSFCVLPFMALMVFKLNNKIESNFKIMKTYIGQINGYMAENISGMRLVQIFRAEKEKLKGFQKLNNAYLENAEYQVWLNSLLRPASEIFKNLSVAVLLWYGMGKISNQTLEIGVLYAFVTYIQQFYNPISDLADNYTTIQSALVSSDRIFELLDQEGNTEDLDSGIPMEKIKGDIEFKNVWFSYNDRDWILKNVCFKIKMGETAAFVGETGAGKTTIINLISGFYKVQKGEILIDGINVDDIRPKDLRRNVAVVLQDVFLFSGTIEKNITLNDNIDGSIVQKAVEMSYANEFIDSMDDGLKSKVMERGSTFSAGQKQLLSFARALAHNPSILILDEATSNIDTHTEKLIQKTIENASRERTTLVIAHRLSTIRNADKIIVLKHGEIIEMGNHAELYKKGGYYYRLCTNQRSRYSPMDDEIHALTGEA